MVVRPAFEADHDPTDLAHLHIVERSRSAIVDQLYATYYDDVRRYVRRRVHDDGVAEDVAQETFLRLLRSSALLDDGRPLWPLLETTARNLVINRVRDEQRRRRHVVVVPDWETLESAVDRHPESDPEKRYSGRERREAISASLGALSSRQRRLLLMKVTQGLSYEDISRSEGLSVDASRSLVKRARRTFRERYASLAAERGLAATVPAFACSLWRRLCATVTPRSLAVVFRTEPAAQTGAQMLAVALSSVVIMLLPVQPGTPTPGRVAGPSIKPLAELDATAEDKKTDRRSELPPPSRAADARDRATDGVDDARARIAGEIERLPDRRVVRVRYRNLTPHDDPYEGEIWVEVPCRRMLAPIDHCAHIDRVSERADDQGR